jgi:nucleotide-binding universal stress UspA family protein
MRGALAVSTSSRVIVGVSGSPGSLRALRYAAGLALRQEAELIAVHAWVPPGGELADRRYPSPYLRQIWTDAARTRLAQALDAAWGGDIAGLAVRRAVVRGEPGQVLVDLAEHGDTLVVGAGRRSWFSRIWHGRVSRYCLSHSCCPIIAVPPSTLGQRWPGMDSALSAGSWRRMAVSTRRSAGLGSRPSSSTRTWRAVR